MIDYITQHWQDLAEGIAAVIGFASIIIRLTPTLKDDAFFLPLVKFIGKFIALDKYNPTARPK